MNNAKEPKQLKVAYTKMIGDFKNDITFLTFIIEHQVNLAIQSLQSKFYTYNLVVTSKNLEEVIIDTSVNVIDSLSDEYKDIMYTYFSKSGFKNFVVERISIILKDKVINMNTSVIN